VSLGAGLSTHHSQVVSSLQSLSSFQRTESQLARLGDGLSRFQSCIKWTEKSLCSDRSARSRENVWRVAQLCYKTLSYTVKRDGRWTKEVWRRCNCRLDFPIILKLGRIGEAFGRFLFQTPETRCARPEYCQFQHW